VRDFVSFYISDENLRQELIKDLEDKGVSIDMTEEELGKSMLDFEQLLGKIEENIPLDTGETIESNTFYIIFQEIQKALLSASQEQFRDFIETSSISEKKKREILDLNTKISNLSDQEKEKYEDQLTKFLEGKIEKKDIRDNPVLELSFLLEEALQKGVSNADLDT